MTQRTFLVTGATKGIGLAGQQVIGIARGPLSTFRGTLVSVDLGDDQASARVISDLVGRLSFDGVVNNAGFGKQIDTRRRSNRADSWAEIGAAVAEFVRSLRSN